MEIEVLVDASSLVEADKGKYRAVSAFFTFISLDKENKPLPVPPLKVGTVPLCFLWLNLSVEFIWSHILFYIHTELRADSIHLHSSYTDRELNMDCLMCPPNMVNPNLYTSLFKTLVSK